MNKDSEKTIFVYSGTMMNDDEIAFSKNLNLLLEKKNVSQHQLAKKLNINKSTLHNYLNGVIPQGLLALVKISFYFKISLDELVFRHPKKGRAPHPPIIDNTEERYEIVIKKIKI